MTEFSDIIAELRRHRADAMGRVEALDKAIAELQRAAGAPTPVESSPDEGKPRRARRGQGVKQQVIDFVQTSQRDWDAHELLREFDRQGQLPSVDNPVSAIHSALSRGAKAGQLVRTAPGRYSGIREELADRLHEGLGSWTSFNEDDGHQPTEQGVSAS